MEKDIQTSFIPKQSLSRDARSSGQPIGLFLLLSLVVLIVALLFLGGAYFYRFKLTDEINRPCSSVSGNELEECGLLPSLTIRRESLRENDIIAFELLDKQLRLADEIIKQHTTLLPVLSFIEGETLKSIKYTSFSQTGVDLNLNGVARNYEGVALQSIELSKNPLIKDFIFSGVNADQQGNVSFALKLTLDQRERIRALEPEPFAGKPDWFTGKRPDFRSKKGRDFFREPPSSLPAVLAILTAPQRERWTALTGRPFDGRISIRIPAHFGTKPGGPPFGPGGPR